MTNEKEIDIINDLIVKRQKGLNSGNESEVKKIEEDFKKAGFEIKDNGDVTTVKTVSPKALKKLKENI